jgi:hypothetical protein
MAQDVYATSRQWPLVVVHRRGHRASGPTPKEIQAVIDDEIQRCA